MLVLTRKRMQSLCINGNIIVTVLKVRGNQVRLGLEVPRGLPVRRQPAGNGTPLAPPDPLSNANQQLAPSAAETGRT